MMRNGLRRVAGKLALAGALVATTSVVLLGCSAGGGASPSSGSAGGNATAPGRATDTISWAEPPASAPNWIWPLLPAADFAVSNSSFEYLMYRPLYWFGDNGKAGPDFDLSLADPPVFSGGGKTVTIKLKDYKWSNGESVTAQDVVFWINMERAEKTNYGGYTPGQFPDNIVKVATPNASTVVLTTDKAYSQQWFLYNQLSQITPMPMAWDMTSATAKGTCATDVSGCPAVYAYLDAQAKDLPGYATSKVWSVVDGPWKLSSFNSDGHVTFVPNTDYSGPQKAQVKQFKMVPFTTDSAEFDVLHGGQTLDVGYIPTQDIAQPKPANSSPAAPGPNPLSANYRLSPWFLYGIGFFPINFNNPTVGTIFQQLPVRQALQSVVDQKGIITSAAKNYGVPTTGPVPLFPSSPLISSGEKNNPYPFSIANAKKYLSDAGWKVVPGGVTTCAHPGTAPGECGAGVAAGAKLEFTLQYASGTATLETAMASVKSNAAQVGIVLNLETAPFNTVAALASPCKKGPSCTWQMENYGTGWAYGPDFYPTGETLFQTGAGSNMGSYSNATLDKLITATTLQSGTAVMQAYEDFMAKNIPVIYQPNYTYALTEIANGLKGYTSQNPYGWINPEDWYF